MSESDIHLLEAYLDDGLSTSEVHRLDSRLSEEPALLEVLDSLRTERAARIAVFQSLTPGQTDVDRLADAVLATVNRRHWRMVVGRYARIAAGVAACLLVGFAVGWIGRGGGKAAHPSQVPAIAVTTPAQVKSDAHLVIHAPKPTEPGQFQVAVLDENGNVIALQRFNKLDDARQFANDLGQYEVRRQQVQESQAMLISDRF